MRIVLINPPFEEWLTIAKDKRRKAILEIMPPLGVAYLAAVLERNNYQVKIYDCSVGISQAELINFLVNDNPDIVGITATSLSFASAKEIAENLRKLLPKAIIAIGGPHVTALPQETMACECFDIGVIGEGEITFLELVKLIEKSGLEYLEDTKGIAYRKDGNVILAEGRDFINDLNELPFPARHLLPSLSRYSPFIASYRKLPIVHIISSRGCPMGCSFCDQAVFGSGYRSRSADNILDEVELVKNKFGVKEIRFYDDVFTLDKKRVFEMCDKIRERNITISWTCFAVVNTISKELLKKMKGAGCWQISFGLESGDEGVLKYLKTDISLEQNEMAVRLAQEAGLSVRAHFVIGSPWETKESLRNTLNFAKRFNIDYAHFIKFMPYPGSKIYNILIKQGYRYDFTKRFSTLNNSDVMYVPESLTKQEFINFLGLARREFYFRPSYILRKIISIRTWNEFIRNIFSFFAIRNFNRP